jgi:hypothetical protein
MYSMGKINVSLVNVSKHQFIKQLRLADWSIGKYTTCPDCTAAGKQRKRVTLEEWTTETQARLNRDAEI